MSVQKINLVQDNTAPPIVLTLERDDVAIDVTGCDVDLILSNGTTITNTGHQACTLTTPESGIVTYTPQDGDFETAGSYKGDVQITYGDGSVERLYDQLRIKARRKLA